MEKPFELFDEWFHAAEASGMKEPTAMNLATVGANGRPSSRIVLLKNWDERGFVFYTNANSHKGKDMAANKNVAVNFYWMDVQKQIRIEGEVEAVKGEEADQYYNSRHPQSRRGALASRQSEVLQSRDELLNAVAEIKQKYGDNPPRPEHWHGFRIKPRYFEFWQEGEFRLHQRDIYEREGDGWKHYLINP